MLRGHILYFLNGRKEVREVSPGVFSQGVIIVKEEDFWITIRVFDRNLYGKKMDGTFGIKDVRESRATVLMGAFAMTLDALLFFYRRSRTAADSCIRIFFLSHLYSRDLFD